LAHLSSWTGLGPFLGPACVGDDSDELYIAEIEDSTGYQMIFVKMYYIFLSIRAQSGDIKVYLIVSPGTNSWATPDSKE
jgi:hypothetical protein